MAGAIGTSWLTLSLTLWDLAFLLPGRLLDSPDHTRWLLYVPPASRATSSDPVVPLPILRLSPSVDWKFLEGKD